MLHTFSVAAPCHQQWVGKSPGLVYSVQSWGQASAAQPTRWYHKSTVYDYSRHIFYELLVSIYHSFLSLICFLNVHIDSYFPWHRSQHWSEMMNYPADS